MIHKRYFEEAARQEKLLAAPNRKTDFYNGIFERYENPVLTREHVPLTWRYDLNAETNPYFEERLGINAVLNSGAIYFNHKYCLAARIDSRMIHSPSSGNWGSVSRTGINASGGTVP